MSKEANKGVSKEASKRVSKEVNKSVQLHTCKQAGGSCASKRVLIAIWG